MFENTRELIVNTSESLIQKIFYSAKETEEVILESTDNRIKLISDSATHSDELFR
jgi:hypothetical protein